MDLHVTYPAKVLYLEYMKIYQNSTLKKTLQLENEQKTSQTFHQEDR